MPEGPEVKTISLELNNLLSNECIKNMEITGGRYKTKGIDKYTEFFSLKESERVIESVNCKGKFIWFKFPGEWSLWCTLGMSGGWIREHKCKHCDVQIQTPNHQLWFQDQRHFGTLKFCDSTNDLNSKLKTLGLDLLSGDVSLEMFMDRFKKYKIQNQTLPKILMNQSIFSGIGNYLKAEILYASKISPHRLFKDVTQEELKDLYHNSIKIINNSFKSGGATIRNYSDIYLNSGKYVFNFKVYGRKIDSNGYDVQKLKTTDGRTTHWVPEIQK